ncbi:hypothetical protein PVNG_06390 [Plasmodium vivax North Korean]|uniref:Variable surface protein Vir7-like protein n=1 Tax=Plasmodium vivax North Korean TaxID=1035514 RepID=A0A0J9TM24_PLAVI|nr:hypothetical protein PVNG_06390 [Plasmodium vivax North Korean]
MGYQWNVDVSDQILKGLCYVYRKRLKNNFESDICKFLYFWLGSILIDRMTHNTVFFDVINDLFKTLKTNNIEKICELPHTYMDVNHFKKIKFFFDYSQDYISYEQQLTGHNHSCNEEYKTYLDKYVKSYKDVKVECADNQNPNSYCNEFYQYFNGKNIYNLSNWKCVLDEHRHEEEELEEDNAAQLSQISPGLGRGIHHATNQKEFPGVTGQKENDLGSPVFPLGEESPAFNGVSNPEVDSSPSTITKSVTSAVSAAGVLVPPFLIYNVITIMIVQ